MKVINIADKFSCFQDHWSPKIIGEMNGQEIKLAKIKGEFVWHDYKEEDELFIVVKGTLKIEFRDRTLEINEGEMVIVPKGVEHKPIAEEEVFIMLIEPKGIKHTGDVKHDLTVEKYDKL
ncbi:MAG: cupin domain-containing protein [Bacteroidetes bacterium]|nr:cupin domain-containing protein [Bacteroidota bacterium]